MHHKLACFANGNFYFCSVLLSTKGHFSRLSCSDNLPKRREFCVGKLSAESGLLLGESITDIVTPEFYN